MNPPKLQKDHQEEKNKNKTRRVAIFKLQKVKLLNHREVSGTTKDPIPRGTRGFHFQTHNPCASFVPKPKTRLGPKTKYCGGRFIHKSVRKDPIYR